jgi:L-alanine-DL-glutamate epimerase-like enolase superfamily enzyme
MKITRIDTTYWRSDAEAPWKPNWIWVRVHADSGLIGVGETYPRNEAEASVVHSTVAGLLLGRDPRDIERIWADLYRTFDYQVTGGAEMRALSTIDLALCDLLGKSLNLPVYRLLGGRSNPKVRLYNTCSARNSSLTRNPCDPVPMQAMLSLSLSATCPLPPRTCRGTIVNANAASPARRLRRVIGTD